MPTTNDRGLDTPITATSNRRVVTDLAPNLDQKGGVVEAEYLYWVGVLPTCPVASIDCAGINFPKLNHRLVKDPGRPNHKRPVPVIGSLVRMTPARLKRLQERVKQTVIRFTDPPAENETPLQAPQTLDEVFTVNRRGRLVTIPTEAERKEAAKMKRTLPTYNQGKWDEPAAAYMFAVLCTDQVNGERRDYYPEPLLTAGLELPEE